MTLQMPERFIYNGEDYYLHGIEYRLKNPDDGSSFTAEEYEDIDTIINFLNEDEELDNVIEGKRLVTPHDYDMIPQATMTSCWRGFRSTYVITNESLFLEEMIISAVLGNPKPIQGVMPILNNLGEFYYQHLKVFIPLTGRITLVSSKDSIAFISNLETEAPVRTLLKITFDRGKLVTVQQDLLILSDAIDRRIDSNKQSRGLIEGVKPIGLLPPADYG